MKKALKVFVFIILFVFIIVWLSSLIRCEILTLIHGDEFAEAYHENTMIGEQKYWKVLKYSREYATVYFVEENRSFGNIMGFEKRNGEWKWIYNEWSTVWSRFGSADGFVWPYGR